MRKLFALFFFGILAYAGAGTGTVQADVSNTGWPSPQAANPPISSEATAASDELSISNFSASPSSTVALYQTLELTFDVNNSVAKNAQWPCDTNQTIPTSGPWMLPAGVGISVDAVFSKGSTILRQPAFLYVPYDYASLDGDDWVHPSGPPVWKVRFAAQDPGAWSYHLEARDGANCERFARYPQNGDLNLFVGPAEPDNHGFLGVSQTDPRYFEFSDGTPFIGVGHGTNVDAGISQAAKDFSIYGANRVNFTRIWFDASLVWSRATHGWDAWRNIGTNSRDETQRFGFSDFSVRLAGNSSYIFQTSDGNQKLTGGLEAGRTYKVRVRAKLSNVNPSGSGLGPSGLVVKLNQTDGFDQANTALYLTPTGFTGDGEWQIFESTFTNTLGRIRFSWGSILMVGLQNVTNGSAAYIDEIYIGEDLATGESASLEDLTPGLGPNAVFKGKVNYHQGFDPLASFTWDRIFEIAEENDLYLKLVTEDKQEYILTCIDVDTGAYSQRSCGCWTGDCNDGNFYSWPGRKVRRLQEYYWRYLIARWGHMPNIHSWELVNEGNPGSHDYDSNGNRIWTDQHADNADHLGEYFRANDPNQHLTTTSYWHSFNDNYFNDPNAGVDYADFHAYNSTGWIDDPAHERDAAQYHISYSQETRSRLDPERMMPIVRGEAGIDQITGTQEELSGLRDDRNGVWLHNYTWALLHPGAVYELYWWPENVWRNDLHFQYTNFRDFMDGVPISDGTYEDALPSVSSPNVRALGQMDSRGQPATHAVLWVQNRNHIWGNVVNGSVSGKLQGTVTIDGFQPSTTLPIEYWEFTSTGNYVIRNSNVLTDANGRAVLDLNSYNSATTDTGVKIGNFSDSSVPGTTFADVAIDHPFHDEIEALYQAGYTAGCQAEPLLFCPGATMNRAESAVFVERGIHGAGVIPVDPTAQVFADLRLDSWAAKWATALYEDGFTAGCREAPLMYCPWQGHTRTEGTVFYLRMLNGADYLPLEPTGVFSDVALDFWGADWIEAAYAAGLIPACGENPLRFCPGEPLTRAMAAYMMVQAKGLLN